MPEEIGGASTRALKMFQKFSEYQWKIAFDSVQNVNETFAIFQILFVIILKSDYNYSQ